jgi:hypothetical protein
MRPQWLADALSGKTSLSRAFWLYGVGISVVYSAIGMLIDLEHIVAVVIYLAVGLALGVVQSMVLWRSAYNTRARIVGTLVRVSMIVGLLFVLLMVYILYMNSDLLLSATHASGP